MNSKKESALKINKREEKLKKVEAQNKDIRKENKYLRRRCKALEQSRTNWKEKAKAKSIKIKGLQRKIARGDKVARHHYAKWLIVLSIQLRLIAGCSYNSICKILKILDTTFEWKTTKLPCANTIQNWVSKVGYNELSNSLSNYVGQKVSLIIDESIRLGKEKLLLVLLIGQDKLKQGALNFKDVEVIYMKGAVSWTGEKIKEVLSKLIKDHDLHVRHILSDEGSSLKKAFRLLNIPHLADIAHALANCLQRTFSKSSEYKEFIKLISAYQAKGVNQELSYLVPPKQRVKARFMNQYKVVDWANKMLLFFDKLNTKEQSFFSELAQHYSMIASLKLCLILSKRIGNIFRNFGLSEHSLQIVRCLFERLQKTDPYVSSFVEQLSRYVSDYEDFMEKCGVSMVEVSSEIIESLLGVYKDKAACCKLTGLTNLNLELPAYCLEQGQIEQRVHDALQSTFMTDLKQWKNEHSSENQSVKRTDFFNNRT